MEEEEKDENKKLTKSEERKQAREEKGVRKKDRAKRKRNEQKKVEERQKKFINTDIYIVQDNTTMTEANDKPVYGLSYVPN